jgi:Fe-S cluster biogenesis protein NfuA
VFIVTERTPNPDAMKFVPHQQLTEGATWSFERKGFDPALSPLATALFAVEGVLRVFVAPDFVTITREATGPGWDELRYAVIAVLADHLESGAPIVLAEAKPLAPADDIEDEIREVLGRHVRPGVARDGGDVLFDRFDADSGVLWIRLQGACGGCPSARQTLKAGVERLVHRYVPEVVRVEETSTEQTVEPPGARLKRWAERLGQGAGPRPGTVFTRSGPASPQADRAAASQPETVAGGVLSQAPIPGKD